MARPRSRQIPPAVRDQLDAAADALAAVGEGADVVNEVYRAVDAAVRAASVHARRREQGQWSTTFAASFAQIIGENLKGLRTEAGWTQAQLAQAMAQIGFPWQRVTVAEVEGAARRVSLEEVVGLAALFSMPALRIILPDSDTALDWTQGDLEPDTVRELFLGQAGVLGEGSLSFAAAAEAAGSPKKDDHRPAVDLWLCRDHARSLDDRETEEG